MVEEAAHFKQTLLQRTFSALVKDYFLNWAQNACSTCFCDPLNHHSDNSFTKDYKTLVDEWVGSVKYLVVCLFLCGSCSQIYSFFKEKKMWSDFGYKDFALKVWSLQEMIEIEVVKENICLKDYFKQQIKKNKNVSSNIWGVQRELFYSFWWHYSFQ